MKILYSISNAFTTNLSGGCSKEPVELLRDMGVDMRTPAPVNDALSLFGELIDELSELLG